MADNVPPPTVKQLIEDLHDVDWYPLGTALGLPVTKLQEIESQRRPSQWKIDMFQFWLQSTPTASWKDVTHALDSSQLRCQALAARLKSKYITRYGSSGNSAPPADPIQAPPIVVKRLRDLESDFTSMLTKSRKFFTNVDLADMRFFLGDLLETDKFKECATLDEILQQLRRGHVDTFNTFYLEQLASHFQKDGMSKLIKEYNLKKEAFSSDTVVFEFLQAIISIYRTSPVLPEEMADITIKVPSSLANERTLKDIERLVARAFEEHYKSFVKLHAVPGSIIIIWFFPKSLADELEQLAQANKALFALEGVQEVAVAGSVVLSQDDLQMFLLTKDAQEHFQECYQETWHSLKQEIQHAESKVVNAREVVHYLRYQHQLQVHGVSLETVEEQLETIKRQLESGISWFNFKPLEGVAEKFLCNHEKVLALWQNHRALLGSYTNRRLEEYRGYDLGAPHSRDRRILKFKLNTAHREMKLSDIYELQDTINKDLGDCRLVLYLAAVQQGELEFHCPSSVCYDMLTLRAEEKEKLKKAGITEVTCPDEQECLQPKNIIHQATRTSSFVTAGMRLVTGSPVLSVENRSETDILLVLKQSGTRATFMEIKREEKLELKVTRGLYTSIMVFGMEEKLEEHLRQGSVNITRLLMMGLEGAAGAVLLATILGAPLGYVLLSDTAQRILGIRDNSPFSAALVDNTLAVVSAEGEMVVSKGSYTMMQGDMSTVIRSSWKPVRENMSTVICSSSKHVKEEKVHWISPHHKARQPHFSHCLKLDFQW